jgi:hypothetical protein
MGKAIKKPVEIEFITFEDFVEFGKNQEGANIVDGQPWSFSYNGHPITHENNECYLIPTLEGTYNFTPDDVLITGVKGEIYPCKKNIFEKTYTVVSSFKDRIGVEREELDGKILKLSSFLQGDIVKGLDEEAQTLLQLQLRLMQEYSDVLTHRLNLLK